MDVAKLFDWVRANQKNKRLEQSQVDAINTMLVTMTADIVRDSLSKLIGWAVTADTTSKRLSKVDIIAAAKDLGVEPAALKAVIDVEAAGEGFDKQGRPIILFEPHIFWDQLTKIRYFTKRDELQKAHPGILSPTWDKSLYKIGGSSYDKLAIAAELNWDAAHKSCSWGLAQVMGFNAEKIGYATLKEFIDDMYESEAKQLKAMGMFLKANGLIAKLQRKDWAGFARGYNGSAYAKNQYDIKLAAAYNLAKKQGW